MSDNITNSELIEATGISASYASMILRGHRPCPPAVAVRVYQMFGKRFGPLASAADDEIVAFIKIHGLEADNTPAQDRPDWALSEQELAELPENDRVVLCDVCQRPDSDPATRVCPEMDCPFSDREAA